MNRTRRRGGFTLAELLIVLAIIGILVSVAIPVFSASTKRAEAAACLSNRTSLTRQLIIEQMTERELSAAELSARAAEIGISCPTGGKYTVKKDPGLLVTVTCSTHSETVSGQVYREYLGLVGIEDNPNNDKMRQEFFETYYPNGCPQLVVNGKSYDIQPYYSRQAPEGTLLEDRIWLFAKEGTSNSWSVSYVLDPVDKVWYRSLGYSGTPGSANTINAHTAADLHEDILNGKQENGKPKWERIPDKEYEEIPAQAAQD